MRVAAYQAPYRPYPSGRGAELVVPRLERARAEGVELLCCPEALIGELANESDGDSPTTVALSVSDGELDEAIAPLLGWGMTIVIGFTERSESGAIYNAAAVIDETESRGSTARPIRGAPCVQRERSCRSSITVRSPLA